jgi:uncharacterized protein (TIGR03000 family)
MVKLPHFLGTGALIAAAALLVPSTAQAQRHVFFVGVPFFGVGRPNVVLPSAFGWGGGYYPFGYGGGYGYGYGGYGYGGYFPYTTYSYSLPLYQYSSPPTSYPLVPLAHAGAYPRMRPATYPELSPYGWAGDTALYGSATTSLATGTHGPAAGAALVGASLTSAPVPSTPAAVATAVAALTPAPSVRQANYPPEPVQTVASRGVYAAGLGPPRAEVDVRLPIANAEIWFDGVRMGQSGAERQFFTPPLRSGTKYTYEVRARWQENGQLRQRIRNIFLRAGDVLEVDFTTDTKE